MTRSTAVERERLESYARLTEQVTALGSTTDTLSRALRTPAVRGRWGEMQLRRVVEIGGDAAAHATSTSSRPSSATTAACVPTSSSTCPAASGSSSTPRRRSRRISTPRTPTTRTRGCSSLQAHARQVRDHMDKLGSKAYWDALDASPEMVVMFLPGETLFSAALQHDLALIEHGLQQRVLLASPITLIALLTTVAHSWRQDALTDNYREVADLGRELHDRLATFAGHLDDVRKRLDGAVQAYNAAAGSFESRVLV